MRIVLCAGVFDLLHAGHVAHLMEARAMADYLIVGLTLDEHVGKPGRPIMSWDERAAMLRELRCVSAVAACRDSVEAIKKLRPHVFVKGGDYVKKGLLKEEIEACALVGAEIRHTAYVPITTTDIVQRIKCAA